MIDKEMKVKLMLAKLSASLSNIRFAMRQANDAAVEFSFVAQVAEKTDNAMRASEICDAVISRHRKPMA